ncbi:MAG: MarP family serine protease [Actinobacteria bacterium]|nr:MarP family serine protease [Actinomycetota bacterium]
MNWVDVLIVVLLVAAAGHGLLRGAVVQALSFGGLAVGFAVGAALAPVVSGLAEDPTIKAVLALCAQFGAALVLGGVGEMVGARASARLRDTGLGPVDAAGGALLAAAGTLLAVWLAGTMLASVPTRPVAAGIQNSAILRALGRAMPPAPSVFARLQRLLDAGGFPQVFAEFEPRPAGRLPAPSGPAVQAAVARARASTVRIEGSACGSVLEGSGFVAAPDLVVTNAHVVAGVDRPVVTAGERDLAATTVLFDPNRDLAVLRVPRIDRPPLALVAGPAARGTTGAALGYPGGGPFDAEPAVVLSRVQALGRDIYGRRLVTRTIYEIQSLVRPGNSGGPLVEPDGSVAGVVFARSTLNNDIGFVLTSDTVTPVVTSVAARTAKVSTGPCDAE